MLFRSTSSTTVSSRTMSAYSGQAGGNQETLSPDPSHIRRSPKPALLVPLPPPTPAALVEDEPSSSKVQVDPLVPDWFLDMSPATLIDETSHLLPVHQIGWGRHVFKQAQPQGNAKEATTFTVAFSMDRGLLDMLVHIVQAEQPWPERTHHVTSENGWASTTTILQLTATLDDVMKPGREGQAQGHGQHPRQRGHPGRHAGRSPTRRTVLHPATKHVVLAALRRGRLQQFSRAASRRKRAPLLPAPSSTARSKAKP